ncbi:MAG: hypothetical protein LUH07_11630 [Lachnospiraceae bacterium]|nr:hypothetical protein [Lachnospiraceae bacterium]
MDNDTNTQQMKICRICGRELPLDNFRIVKIKGAKPYHRSECRECNAQYNKEYVARKKEENGKKNDDFSDNIEIVYKRKYKEIHPARILDLSQTGLDITLLDADEIFVRLMEYPNSWLSNYGRLIRKSYNKYRLLKGNNTASGLSYTVRWPVYENDKWVSKEKQIYAATMVVETFIVNPDIANNTNIWHSGNNTNDYYYKNLYPVTSKQYDVICEHYNRTGEDSEEYILKVINDIRFKADEWSRKTFRPTVCGVGYHGCSDVDHDSQAYIKWKNMIERCYNQNTLKWHPAWTGCTVCDEWLNFSNFRFWYEAHEYEAKSLSLDKDILMKGNRVYCPEFCALVPKDINLLMIGAKGRDRHGLPIGVYKDNRSKKKYWAEMEAFGKNIRIGRYMTPEEAFQHYKEYKEGFLRKIAEQRKDKIPFAVYDALMNWKVEITD